MCEEIKGGTEIKVQVTYERLLQIPLDLKSWLNLIIPCFLLLKYDFKEQIRIPILPYNP